MATAATIIERSLRMLGQIGAGEVPTDDEYADALEALNAMLDSWRNERLMCYSKQQETVTLAVGDSGYTIGPAGDLNTTRPIAILGAWIRDGDIDYPVRLINEAEYEAIPAKTTRADWPDRLLFRPQMPSAAILVYPVPNATRTLILLTQIPLAAFTSTSSTVTLPPGWERALAANLAIEIAPEYETEAPPAVRKAAAESLAGIKRSNIYSQPRTTATELGAMFAGDRGTILSGEV